MISGKTDSGFAFELDEAALNDMELLEDMAALDAGRGDALPSAVRRLLGEEQKARLYDHLRSESGRVPIDAACRELQEILAKAGEAGKKS